MARGIFQIINVTSSGGFPPTYTLEVDTSTGISSGDHIGARVADGSGAVYSVVSVSVGEIIVSDNLTEAESGSFGFPVIGKAAFGTPGARTEATILPFGSPGWDAMNRRNHFIFDAQVSGITGPTGPTGDNGDTGPTGTEGPTGPAGAA